MFVRMDFWPQVDHLHALLRCQCLIVLFCIGYRRSVISIDSCERRRHNIFERERGFISRRAHEAQELQRVDQFARDCPAFSVEDFFSRLSLFASYVRTGLTAFPLVIANRAQICSITNSVMATPAMESADPVFDSVNGESQLSEAETALLKDELRKTEEEIQTLKQVLLARQKHAAELKRKLGLNPLVELGNEVNKGIKAVTETEAFHKTSEVAAATADTVKHKWNDMRNSSLFKSFESKLGTAYNSAKMAASTSIDHLSQAARGSTATTPAEETKPTLS
ncbi:unnamed protein product [Cylicocyclus nassatus]|uniref:Tumor protein D52 n=1 Tax=Cylicocyclus nassatus TaxID=53992 RepID=A0AA36GZZ7_CYLNA|nr:unnamed protein product [Cylicocyclus nassatus]